MNTIRRIAATACLGLVITTALAAPAQAAGDGTVPPGEFARVPRELVVQILEQLPMADVIRFAATSHDARVIGTEVLDGRRGAGDLACVPHELLAHAASYLSPADVVRLSQANSALRDALAQTLAETKHRELLCPVCARDGEQPASKKICPGCDQQTSLRDALSVGKHGERYSCGHVVHVPCTW